jgi:hypothetical protein
MGWLGEQKTKKFGHVQDYSKMQWQLEDNFEMMLKNGCSCILFEMFSWRWYAIFSNSCLNGGM